MNPSLQALSDAGVSISLDDLSRQRLATGNLAALVADYNVTGVTTNPTIFAAALTSRDHYTPQLSGLAAAGVDADQAMRRANHDWGDGAGCTATAPSSSSPSAPPDLLSLR